MFVPPGDWLLTTLQLADSFFPTGLYAHSQGLEGMARRGLVRDAEEVEEFLKNQLTWSLLPADGVALLNAHRSAAAGDLGTVRDIDRLLYAMKLPTELRSASTQVGRRLLDETSSFAMGQMMLDYAAKVESRESPGNGAVALGVVAWTLGIPEGLAALAFCHSHLVGVLGASLRLLRLTHSDVQTILRRLHPLLADLLEEIWDRPWQDMTAFTPELDIASMGHEADDLRLFAS